MRVRVASAHPGILRIPVSDGSIAVKHPADVADQKAPRRGYLNVGFFIYRQEPVSGHDVERSEFTDKIGLWRKLTRRQDLYKRFHDS